MMQQQNSYSASGLQDDFGRRIAARLSAGTGDMPYEITERLHNMSQHFAETLVYLQQLTSSLNQTTEKINHDVLDTLSNLQFQDITRQQLEQVTHGLERLSNVADALADGSRTGLVAPLQVKSLEQHLDELKSSYVMQEQHAVHDQSLGLGSALPTAAPAASSRVELF